MKVGILTFQRAINYGAVLQAYALQETLRRLGHDAWVIDYRQHRVENTDRGLFSSSDKVRLLLRGHLRSWYYYDKNKATVIARRQRFDQFLHSYLQLTDACDEQNIPQDFDAYVIGSDQVWNSRICDGIDQVYWGDFQRGRSSKLLSYAASTSVKDLQANVDNSIFDKLNNFDALSVRESQVADFLNQSGRVNQQVYVVLDPTLLADSAIWDAMTSEKPSQAPYILYFAARGCDARPNVVKEKAERLARMNGMEAKPINFGIDSPQEFVAKFRHAAGVVTSSFHGVAFSLIFNRPLFAVQYGDEQDSRYVNVLRTVGADSVLTRWDHDDETLHDVDYSDINVRINLLRLSSIQFLKQL